MRQTPVNQSHGASSTVYSVVGTGFCPDTLGQPDLAQSAGGPAIGSVVLMVVVQHYAVSA
jgi:hypothetical protein